MSAVVKHRRHLRRTGCPTCSQDRERGAVIPVVALTLVTLITMAAMTVDLGRLMIKRRDLQALSDVVALDLARDLDGSAYSAYTGAKLTALNQHRDQSVTRNGGDPTKVTYVLGMQNGKGTTFTPASAGTDVPNAVKVTATDSVQYIFATVIGQTSGSTTRSAVAGQNTTVDFEAGSFLASTVQAGLLNGLIGGTLAGPINLSVLSYQGLGAASVPLGPLSTQLGFGSPDQMLAANVGQKQLYLASATVLSAPGGCNASASQCTAAISALNTIAAQTSGTTQVNLGQMISVAQGGSQGAAAGSINALGLVSGSAFLVNGTNTISVPNVNVNIPGVGTVTTTAVVTQKMQQQYGAKINAPGDPYSRIQTSQIDLTITTNLSIGLSGVLTTLSGPLTVRVQIASATAWPSAAACSAPKSTTISVTPQPVVVSGSEHLTALGLLGLQVLKIDINGPAIATLTGSTGSQLFNYTTDFRPTVGTGADVNVGSSTLGLPTLFQGTSANATLLNLPLGSTLSSLLATVNAGLQPVLQSVDDLIVKQVTQVLGVYLGGAAVGAIDMHCNSLQLIG